MISAGFREIGERGAELERQVLLAAQPFGMRIMGPNCLGHVPDHGPEHEVRKLYGSPGQRCGY